MGCKLAQTLQEATANERCLPLMGHTTDTAVVILQPYLENRARTVHVSRAPRRERHVWALLEVLLTVDHHALVGFLYIL